MKKLHFICLAALAAPSLPAKRVTILLTTQQSLLSKTWLWTPPAIGTAPTFRAAKPLMVRSL